MIRRDKEAVEHLDALTLYLAKRVTELRTIEAGRWLGIIVAAPYGVEVEDGGIKGWARFQDKKTVETLTAEFDDDGLVTKVWQPGIRHLASNPFGVRMRMNDELHGEFEEVRYLGITTLASSVTTWIGFERKFKQVLVYHLV